MSTPKEYTAFLIAGDGFGKLYGDSTTLVQSLNTAPVVLTNDWNVDTPTVTNLVSRR